METTLYDERRPDIEGLKKRMTLDLGSFPAVLAKRQKVTPIMLTSPDLHMLKLGSPELERLIISQSGLVTPTPSQALIPKGALDEHDSYTRGFVDALNQVHKSCVIPKPVEAIKEEYRASEENQKVPCRSTTPPDIAPIPLHDQERLKLERKRHRNRLAATKCRQKKLEKIATLEEKVAQLKDENSSLNGKVHRLRESVDILRRQILEHINRGCELQLTPELSNVL